MSTINTYFEQSLLSAAVYADLTDSNGDTLTNENSIKDALKEYGFSASQADLFFSKFTLVHASDDSITGFDGALFINNGKTGSEYNSF